MLFIVDANGVPSVASMVKVAQSNTSPTVTLTQPTDKATFAAPATINLAATASDLDGSVTKVEFFNGSTKLGEDATAPYTLTWSSVAVGTYTLTARATDDAGATTTSGAATVTVAANSPPTVAITSPTDGATFAWKPTITVTATAGDTGGNVTAVEFRDGSTLLGQDTTAPYSFTWRNVAQGTHVLTARATDNAGAATTSSPVGITVRPKR
jgi:chitinase